MIAGALLMVGAALLVVAGAQKVVQTPTVGLVPRWAARPLGMLELVVGAWALVSPGDAAAWANAALWSALSLAMAWALARRAPDCGCFGATPVRPDPLHLGVNLLFAVAGVVAATRAWDRPSGIAAAASIGLAVVGALLIESLLTTGAEVRSLVGDLATQRAASSDGAGR